MDYAPDLRYDTSDVTRMWPVSGTYTAEQRGVALSRDGLFATTFLLSDCGERDLLRYDLARNSAQRFNIGTSAVRNTSPGVWSQDGRAVSAGRPGALHLQLCGRGADQAGWSREQAGREIVAAGMCARGYDRQIVLTREPTTARRLGTELGARRSQDSRRK